MFAAMSLAGYSASEADELRKAISKKNADALAKHREKFMQGCEKNNIRKDNSGNDLRAIGKTLPATGSTRATPPITG